MSLRSSVALALFALAVHAPSAFGFPPPPGDDGGGNDSNKNHVRKLKPWKAKFEYRMVADTAAKEEPNPRADLFAQTLKGMWMKIRCQVYVKTQNGTVLWNHIPNVGWVPDQRMKTYTDGRLEGSPTCAIPFPNHVWYEQAWSADKLYRAKRALKPFDRPGGAPLAGTVAKDHWVSTNCHQRRGRKQWVSIDFGTREGFVPAGGLRFWQQGLPGKMPSCIPVPAPARRFVAMGDSYASGTGAGNYYAGDGNCNRSVNSYWNRLRVVLKHGLKSADSDFVACHGATTDDIRHGQAQQLDSTVRLITLSIGGNDMDFREVMDDCVKAGPRTCEDAIAETFTRDRVRTLRKNLRATYSTVRAWAPNATVFVLGYPELVPRDEVDGCGAISDDDIPDLRRAARVMNNSIKRAIGKRKSFHFVSLVRTFLGHSACHYGVQDWINGVSDPIENSFHPNARGHAAIAAHLRRAAKRWFKQP
jgi:lysophospholipase L1-like esterase